MNLSEAATITNYQSDPVHPDRTLILIKGATKTAVRRVIDSIIADTELQEGWAIASGPSRIGRYYAAHVVVKAGPAR